MFDKSIFLFSFCFLKCVFICFFGVFARGVCSIVNLLLTDQLFLVRKESKMLQLYHISLLLSG